MRRTLILGLLALVGCDFGTDPTPVAAGNYVLKDLDGAALPATITWTDSFGGENVYRVTSGYIQLRSDNTYTDSTRTTDRDGLWPTDVVHRGTYEVSGSAVTMMRSGHGETCAGTLTRTGLLCLTPRGEGVYARQ